MNLKGQVIIATMRDGWGVTELVGVGLPSFAVGELEQVSGLGLGWVRISAELER